jgi:hypothetical protein
MLDEIVSFVRLRISHYRFAANRSLHDCPLVQYIVTLLVEQARVKVNRGAV